MRLRFPHVLSALFLLFPGKAPAVASGTSGGGGSGGNSGDNVTVSILIFLLLFLLLMLFLAWRRLSRQSEGRYHPQRLMRVLILHWQEFWGEARAEERSQGYRDEMQSDEELGERRRQRHEDDTEEEQQQQLLPQADSEQEEEEEAEKQLEDIDSEPPKDAGVQEPSEEDGASRATEGRAEALLSGLHSFSGTAAWEDSGKQLHVTAL